LRFHAAAEGRLSQLRVAACSASVDSLVSRVLIVPSLIDHSNKLISQTSTLKSLAGRCRCLYSSASLHIIFPPPPANLEPAHREMLNDLMLYAKHKHPSGITVHRAPANSDLNSLRSLATLLLNGNLRD
jgi:hypothetical protein